MLLLSRGTNTGIFVPAAAPEAAAAEMKVSEFEGAANVTSSEKTTPGFETLVAMAMMSLVAVTARKRRWI